MKKRFPYPRTRGEISHDTSSNYIVKDVIDRYNAAALTNQTSYVSAGAPYIGNLMEDIVTPDFRERSAKGEIIISPCSRYIGGQDVLPFSGPRYEATFVGSFTPRTGDSIHHLQSLIDYSPSTQDAHFSKPTLPDSQSVLKQAMNEAIANSHQRDVMGIVDLAEMGKTRDMLRTQLGRIESIAHHGLLRTITHELSAKNRRRRNAKMFEWTPRSELGYYASAANLWLEVQYGIIPLMLSVKGLCKALGEPIGPAQQPLSFRGKDRLSDQLKKTTTHYDPTGFTSGDTLLRNDFTVEIGYNYVGRAAVMTRYRPDLKNRLGFSIRDVPSAGYELIPFSFVCDWVFDLGTYIEAAVPLPGLVVDGAWNTLAIEEVHTYTHTRGAASGQTTSNWNCNHFPFSASRSFSFIEYHRARGVAPSLPSINLQLNSWKHMVSGAALSFQALNKSLASMIRKSRR